ncbi:hypothetical protein HY030_03855 [Candidatus Gottesmanbacteria bacterium]|nr:hypothetical protein [Candidatus Gottesmanbacteria bacterium]
MKNIFRTLIIFTFVLSLLSPGATYARQNEGDKRKFLGVDLQLKESLKSRGIKIIDAVVTAKNTSTLTVTKDDKSYTVLITSDTKFRRHFWGKSTFAEISIGDRVNVWGNWTDDSHTTINAMMIRNLSIMKRFGVIVGNITSKSSTSFVILTNNKGEQTVKFDNSTKFVKKNDTTITYTDVNIGDRVKIKGLWDKTLNTISEVTQVKDYTLPL